MTRRASASLRGARRRSNPVMDRHAPSGLAMTLPALLAIEFALVRVVTQDNVFGRVDGFLVDGESVALG